MVSSRPRRVGGSAWQLIPSRRERPPTTTGAAPALTLRYRVHAVVQFLRSTPGKLTAVGTMLIVLVLATGFVATRGITQHQVDLTGLLDHTEPLANASQSLYSALSIADASANTAFLSGGIEDPSIRQRYQQSLAEASAAIVAASQGVSAIDDSDRQLLAELNSTLPVYAGLVDTARAHNRSARPVGSAYLSEASDIMHQRILPQAEELYRAKITDVSSARPDSSDSRLLIHLLIALTIVALVLSQWWLFRITNRRINPGLLLATVIVVGLMVWVLVVSLSTSRIGIDGVERDSRANAQTMEQLTRARIAAQQARSEETLGLVRRQDLAAGDSRFRELTRSIEVALEPVSGDTDSPGHRARTALEGWQNAHQRMYGLLQDGDYPGATGVATGQGPGDSRRQFQDLDTALQHTIAATRADLRHQIGSARDSASLLNTGIINLVVLTAVAIGAGLIPRLREFQ